MKGKKKKMFTVLVPESSKFTEGKKTARDRGAKKAHLSAEIKERPFLVSHGGRDKALWPPALRGAKTTKRVGHAPPGHIEKKEP